MSLRFKYALYLFVFGLFFALSSRAQYNEQDLLKEAEALFDAGRYAEAMPKYSQLLSLNPTNPNFNYKYGATALYGDADKKEEAIKYLRFAAGKEGIDPKAWYFLGRAYHLNYLFQDAINAYEKYKSLASKKDIEALGVDLKIESSRSGQSLLSNIKEIKVLDKKQSSETAFFRMYDLSDIGGKILVTPDELLSSEDKKRNHKSLIHYRGTGTTVFFSSYGKSGENGLDIYQADVLPGGTFSQPKLVSGMINTPYDEDYPFLHPDNKTFYFSSTGHGSMGGFDVFKAVYEPGSGTFGNPKNLDFAINTPDDDLFYVADSLNQLAHFASARSSEQGQLHVYKVLVKQVPVDLTLVKGTFTNQVNTSARLAKITIIDASTNQQIDIQYTDPASGEYVLSFPKSGKYKFLVEAKNSAKVHAGIVDIPKGTGVTAYLQEMELVSSAGVEKLLINNLFDQTYQGDITVLAQKMLRQKAALDVNFNPEITPLPEETETAEKNAEIAYSDAGFGAGMSNEKILEQAEARVEKLRDRQMKLQQLVSDAAAISNTYFEDAESRKAKVDEKLAKAESLSGDERNKLMFEAGLERLRAKNAIQKAENSQNLTAELQKLEEEASKTFKTEKARVDSLRDAIDSKDYDQAFAALVREKSVRESVDKVEDRFDVEGEIRRKSIRSEEQARKLLDRAMALRKTAEDMNASLITKRRQAESLSGKEKSRVEEEVKNLESDLEAQNRRAQLAFDQAEDAQNLAFNETQQFEILVQINDPSEEIKSPATTKISWTSEDEKLLSTTLEALPVDESSVASYLKDHPEALSEESPEFSREFRKTFIAATPKEEELASAESDNSSQKDISQSSKTAGEEALAVNSPESEISSGENEIPDTGTKQNPEDQADEKPDTGKSPENPESITDSVDSERADVNQADPNTGKNERIISEDIDNEDLETKEGELALNTKEEANIQSTSKVTTDSIPAVKNESNLSVEEGLEDTTLDNDEPEVAKGETLKTKDFSKDYDQNLPLPKRIEAEQLKVNAAKDWVAIIDESIEDLNAGQGGEEDVEQQLKDYEELRIRKMEEINAREANIALWQSELKSEGGAEAIAAAKKDVDSLDASLYARLEGKVNSYSIEIENIKPVNEIDKNYLPELASIELSGKSAPEIAQERIALNESFLTKVEQLINGKGVTSISEEKLLEIRRIKAIELAQDQKILTGFFTYQPRSSEAREYAQLLNPVEPEAQEPRAPSLVLSPEIANDLSKTFSEDLIMEGYSDRLSEIEADSTQMSGLNEKVLLKEELLVLLKDEIAIYSAAIEASNGGSEDLKARYSELLNLRSELVDELNSDKQELQSFEAELAARTSEVVAVADNTDIGPIESATAEDKATVETNVESNSAELVFQGEAEPFLSEFDSLRREIVISGLSETEERKRLADLNRAMAAKINSRVDELVGLLDNPASAVNRDQIQASIQELDAISADKRQEADRLAAEAEKMTLAELENAEEREVNREEVNKTASPGTLSIITKDELASIESISSTEVTYKSLNANIIHNESEDIKESMRANRAALADLEAEIVSTDDESRYSLIDKAGKLETEILAQRSKLEANIARSNAAEIEYFRSESKRILSNLDPKEFEGEERRAKLKELSDQFALLEAEMLEISKSENNDLEQELELIKKLESLNSDLIASFPPSTLIATEENNQTNLSKEDVSVAKMALNPASHRTLPEKTYLSEFHQTVNRTLPAEKRDSLVKADINLALSLEEGNLTTSDQKLELIQSRTDIDEKGYALLSEKPENITYLVSAIEADSLRTLEKQKAAFAEELMANALEKTQEAQRLRNVSVHQNSENDKKAVLARAERIETESEVLFEKASIAAQQAEELRSSRRESEELLAKTSLKLNYRERNSLNQLLNRPAYTVVPSDLADADEISEPITTSPDSGSEKDQGVSKQDAVQPSKNEVAVVTTPPSKNLAPETIVKASEDETESRANVLPDVEGNWLAMVEIIAEKDDFSDVEESMFVTAKEAVYSEETPIPIDPPMPKGLIFQVQVGAFRNKIPQDLYGKFAPIMGQRLDNGITRYRAGLFELYREAIEAREKIKEAGYTDAFVVAYIDGERLTGEQALQILAQAKEKENLDSEFVQGTNRKEADTESIAAIPSTNVGEKVDPASYYNDPEAAEATQVEAVKGLFYTVQVGVYSKPVKLDQLYNLTELNSELTSSGFIRYTSGRFGSVEAASQRKSTAREKGVSDAFVTAYYNGKRIKLEEAAEILALEGEKVLAVDQKGSVDKTSPDEIKEGETYIVVMGTFAGDIPQDLANVFLENDQLRIRRISGPQGESIYISQEIKSYEEARDLLELSKDLGISSAMIGRMKDGKIVGIETK